MMNIFSPLRLKIRLPFIFCPFMFNFCIYPRLQETNITFRPDKMTCAREGYVRKSAGPYRAAKESETGDRRQAARARGVGLVGAHIRRNLHILYHIYITSLHIQ